MIRQCLRLVAVAFALVVPARAEPAPSAASSDATLTALIQQSLAARPELARARAVVRASEQRAPRVRALPDPMLQVGIQNDGFTSIEIGRMDTSYVSLMASQTFPWPGKLELQGRIAELGVIEAKNGLTRARLSTEAEVRRGYLELLFVRDRLALLDQLEGVWRSSLASTRILYRTGGASQSDLLRAELELRRLEQRRLGLRAEESARVQALNRLRNQRWDAAIATQRRLQELPRLNALRAQFSAETALARSPELATARLGVARADKTGALAERIAYPDLTVGAGIMFRGALPPMWQVTLGGPVPVFSPGQQSHAVTESRAWASAAQSQVAELEQLIRLRSRERETAFAAVSASVEIYEQGLLIQSKAAAESSLIQYRVGQAGFTAVLAANAGYLADQEDYLESIATAHRILIAEAEVSLSPVEMPQSTPMAAPAAPGGAQSGM